jgi:hypothetical protein
MLAYVFWHWPREGTDPRSYCDRLERFHRALAASGPPGFRGSRSFLVEGVPGVAHEGALFEDWYFVDDFAALGVLNDAAVAAPSRPTHDDTAREAAGGAGGLYRLHSARVASAAAAAWFGKPEGTSYAAFFASMPPEIELWQRQMVLGPAPEFCALAGRAADLDPLAERLGTFRRASVEAMIL